VVLDLERLQSGDVLGSEVTGQLEVAAFLDGFDIIDSAEFTHWKDRQQARLLPVIKDALLILIDRCRRTGDTRQIEQLADRMLALDELSEEAIRAKMEARAFAGDRLTALEIFEEWKVKLAEELHAAPSDLLEGMAVRLRRRGWERTTLTNIPNVPTDQWRGRPFIGRTAEYRVLYEAWEGVKKGLPGHALILGDSGVGKTTLAQRLATAAGLEGAAISRVQCYDVEREIPYSTLSSLVLGLLDRPGVLATAPEDLAELARVVPEVRHRFPNIPAPSDSQGEAARIRLTDAFQQLLTAISEEHPVILVVDDLHLADDVSLGVLHLIMRRTRGKAVMVLMIARPGELPQSSQAMRLRDSAVTLEIRELELLPLNDDYGRDMLRSLIQSDEPQPGASDERILIRAAAGYPMVLELLVQDWKTSGDKSLALSLDAMTADLDGGGTAEAAYRKLLDRITRSLDSTAHSVLNLASLLGHRLNDLSLYELIDLGAGQTMSGMAELVNRRVLRDGGRGLEFVNELVRAAAYVGVPPSLRRILHCNIADRFIQQHGSGRADLGLEIAWHCIRAGRSEEATLFLLYGARNAIDCGAPYAAERALATALSHLVEPSRTEALLLLAEALQEQSRWEESLHCLDETSKPQQCSAQGLAFVLRTRARRWMGHLDLAELVELPMQLLKFIESSTDCTSRIKAAEEAASVLNASRSRVLAPRILQAILSLQEEDLKIDDREHLLLAKSMLLYNLKDFASSLRCIDDAMALFQKHNSVNSVLAMLQNGVGAILSRQGKYDDSIRAYQKSYQTANRVGNDRLSTQASANLALSFVRLGRYDEAVDWAQQALAFNLVDAAMGYHLLAAESAVLSYAMRGNSANTEELIQKRREEFARVGSPGISQGWGLYSADGYAMIGEWDKAQEEGKRATTGANSLMHMDSYVGPYARWVARTSHLLGKAENGHTTIHCLIENLAYYDVIDRAEILNAQSWLESRQGNTRPAQMARMISELRSLPLAVGDQLRRMGMLDFC
jgi:tetratricopeptide (TPR) repeat protein